MRTTVYVLIFALLIQLGLPYVVPTPWVHNARVDYDTVKNNMPASLGVAMDMAAREIREHPEQDYVVLIGDSVTYSAPGPADQSLGARLEQYFKEKGHPTKVYNFAEPGMTSGDIYTVVLMLKEHGVPLKRVVLNQVYADFTYHGPYDPLIGWLGDDLRKLDPDALTLAHASAARPTKPMVRLRQQLLSGISLWKYRDFLRSGVYSMLHIKNIVEPKDTRPWTAKKLWLNALMKEPAYQRWVDPKPMDLSQANPAVRLVERTFGALDGAEIFVWFAPFNQELMGPYVSQPGYQENLKKLDEWYLTHTQIHYVQWRTAIDPALFTDHVHMTGEGYAKVANMLGDQMFPTMNK